MNSHSPIVSGYKQKGGTCWFHGALNGLLMSPIARQILKKKIASYKHSVFWNFVRQRLEGRGDIQISNENVIRSIGLRKRNSCVRGGNFMDMYKLYEKLFPGDYKVSFTRPGTPTFVFKHGTKFDRVVEHKGVTYVLSHVYITLNKRHIVAGFINKNGNPKLYDSAKNVVKNYRWDEPSGKNEDVHKVAVYVKSLARKYVNKWRRKIAVRKAVNFYSGSGSRYMRARMGNFPGQPLTKVEQFRKRLEQNTNTAAKNLMKYLYSKNIHTPVLYKGLKGKNANNFLRNGSFSTKAPTSTSKNRYQAHAFTNSNKPPVLIVMNRGKYPAMVLGHHGIHARQPREKEVLLAPGTFKLKYKNTNGNYHVNYKPLIK
jgi:transcriptional regulator of met regulon